MKRLLPYSLGALLLILLSFVLPYMKYDFYEVATLFDPSKTPKLVEKDILISGTKTTIPLLPLVWISIVSFIVIFKKTLKTATIGFVGMIVLAILMIMLHVGLTGESSIFRGVENVRFLSGYYLAAFTTIAYLIVTLLNLLFQLKERIKLKFNSKKDTESIEEVQ